MERDEHMPVNTNGKGLGMGLIVFALHRPQGLTGALAAFIQT